jgi:hypothetical protein
MISIYCEKCGHSFDYPNLSEICQTSISITCPVCDTEWEITIYYEDVQELL